MQKDKIIIINISNIGDIVSSLSVVKAISKYYEVDFFTREIFRSLLTSEGYLNLVDKSELETNKYSKLVDLTSSAESRKIVKAIHQINTKIGMYKSFFHHIKQRFYYNTLVKKNIYNHIVKDYYPILEAFSMIEKNDLEMYPTMSLDENLTLKIDDIKFVSIHIGARNPIRSIPMQLIYEICNYIHTNYKMAIYILGDDQYLIDDLLHRYDYIKYTKTNLSKVKFIIKKSQLFIGPDSGLLHIASSLNTKSIGIFGPNIPEICAPLNPCVKIVEKNISCRPCNQNIKCLKNLECLNSIKINDLVDLIDKELSC